MQHQLLMSLWMLRQLVTKSRLKLLNHFAFSALDMGNNMHVCQLSLHHHGNSANSEQNLDSLEGYNNFIRERQLALCVPLVIMSYCCTTICRNSPTCITHNSAAPLHASCLTTNSTIHSTRSTDQQYFASLFYENFAKMKKNHGLLLYSRL